MNNFILNLTSKLCLVTNQVRLSLRNIELTRTMAFFKGEEDRFHGITVKSENNSCPIKEFESRLNESLREWKENKKRGIWFKINLDNSDWIPILAKKGFNFHHAKPGFVMMYTWLAPEKCNIPPYAHTILAIGGIVINSKNEVLVVKERYYLTPHWKFPGGMIEPGEDIIHAAEREVKEETNIECEFESLVTVRHTHNTQFGCSDLYILVAMKALSTEIKKCDREIVEAKWIDINEYIKSDATETNVLSAKMYLEQKKRNIKITNLDAIHKLFKRRYTIFFADDADKSLVGKL